MVISYTQLQTKKLIICLGIFCSSSGTLVPQAVYSQTSTTPSLPVIKILRVTANGGTTFKLQDNWFRQSGEITQSNEKCSVRTGDKFFVSSLNDNRNSTDEYRNGNRVERLKDYYTVQFDRPLPCNQQNQTWYIFKNHVQQLQAVPVR
ncbi:hypothetical protein [Nostoc sp. TCL26-01]|uniref:hypothetical protein n=1 Tax=Nostoc sp. TCL26-01 TaxID=2576904 RepID=UPI0015BE11EB|nr:hypothetical protein [Nostoc sp. TCL26-01]QLE56974.1 hypothetical protein FD725_16485 [Nostoc sp. TCL26-01]